MTMVLDSKKVRRTMVFIKGHDESNIYRAISDDLDISDEDALALLESNVPEEEGEE